MIAVECENLLVTCLKKEKKLCNNTQKIDFPINDFLSSCELSWTFPIYSIFIHFSLHLFYLFI